MAAWGYSASAPTSATVFGFGFMVIATSKKPLVRPTAGSGPLGMIWKYLSYLNRPFGFVPKRVMKHIFRCMAMGIAGAMVFVP